MKKILFVSISFFLMHNSFAQDWYKQTLSSYASIDFPAKPVKGDTLGEDIYTLVNDTVFYLVSVRDLSALPKFALKPEELDKFQDEVIRGAVDACKGKIVSKQPFEMMGLRGVDAVITSSDIIGMPDLRFKRVIFINKTIYQFDFWIFSDLENKTKKDRERFFNSFTLVGDTSTLKQHTLTVSPTDEQTKNEKSTGISMSMIVAIIIGILTAIFAVWLKARMRKKNG